jgi:hypothetical protein
MTVKDRKKQLVKEMVHTSPTASSGMKLASILILLIIGLRLIHAVYEIVFFSMCDVKISIFYYLFILCEFFILYMVYDGNKGLGSVIMIAAFIRIIYYFSSVYPLLSENTGTAVFTAVYITVMLFQFVASILLSENAKCKEYFNIMQRINFKIRGEMMNKK